MPRIPFLRAFSFTGALTLLLFAGPALALQVTGIRAENRNGQTFISWNNLPGAGWSYHVYQAQFPLLTLKDFNYLAWEIGVVGDSSAVDRRMTSLLGTTTTYRLNEAEAPLAANRGMFVMTPLQDGYSYYLVLAENATFPLDYQFLPAQNTTELAIEERLGRPRPILQGRVPYPPCDYYVLFANAFDVPGQPALWAREGRAMHFGVVRGQPGSALVLRGHGRGHSFFSGVHTTGRSGETVIAPDDYLDTWDVASFFLGYNTIYDPDLGHNPFATGGVVVDYVDRFVMSLIDWGQATFQTDPQRTYAIGTSMGGSFAFFLAWHHPERISAAMAVVPKTCMAYFGDTSPTLTATFERMWSPLSVDLPTIVDGTPVFDYMDGRALSSRYRARGAAPVFGVVGRRDVIVSWEEKPLLFQALDENRVGETWYWDDREHSTPSYATALEQEQNDELRLYRFRLDRSYPALSRCSANSNPGGGTTADGDSVGSYNGHVTWDDTFVDEANRWECVLRPAAIRTRSGLIPPPSTITVDVTPRRLQRFVVTNRTSYAYTATDATTGEFLAGGPLEADADYLITVPAVPVRPGGTRLHLQSQTLLGVGDGPSARAGVRMALGANPVRGETTLSVEWPADGPARVDLYDVTGRRARSIHAAPARGTTNFRVDARDLAPGVYLVSARQGTVETSERIVVVR